MHIQMKNRKTTENFPQEAEILDLEDKEFKLALPKCLQRKGNHVCGIEESMAVMSHQIENSKYFFTGAKYKFGS